MAGVTAMLRELTHWALQLEGRWSRAAARERWSELGNLMRGSLMTAMVLTAVWPTAAYFFNWSNYRNPLQVGGLLVVAVALPLCLCWFGPQGLGAVTSALAVVVMAAIEVLLPGQTIDQARQGVHWIDGWGAAVVIVLAFSRPIEEVVLSIIVLVAVNIVVLTMPFGGGPAQLGESVITGGIGLPAAVCVVVVISALRRGLRVARSARVAADIAEEHRAVNEAIQRERRLHFATWDAAVAPFLEDVANGRRSPSDEGFAEECSRLSRLLRQELVSRPDSLIEMLLRVEIAAMRDAGGHLLINDLGVGHRISAATRIKLVELLRDLCVHCSVGEVQLALLAGDPDDRAVAVLAVEGAGLPDSPAWRAAVELGTVTFESPTHWWWDLELRCEPLAGLRYPLDATTIGR